jgi:hypothetical protein
MGIDGSPTLQPMPRRSRQLPFDHDCPRHESGNQAAATHLARRMSDPPTLFDEAYRDRSCTGTGIRPLIVNRRRTGPVGRAEITGSAQIEVSQCITGR